MCLLVLRWEYNLLAHRAMNAVNSLSVNSVTVLLKEATNLSEIGLCGNFIPLSTGMEPQGKILTPKFPDFNETDDVKV